MDEQDSPRRRPTHGDTFGRALGSFTSLRQRRRSISDAIKSKFNASNPLSTQRSQNTINKRDHDVRDGGNEEFPEDSHLTSDPIKDEGDGDEVGADIQPSKLFQNGSGSSKKGKAADSLDPHRFVHGFFGRSRSVVNDPIWSSNAGEPVDDGHGNKKSASGKGESVQDFGNGKIENENLSLHSHWYSLPSRRRTAKRAAVSQYHIKVKEMGEKGPDRIRRSTAIDRRAQGGSSEKSPTPPGSDRETLSSPTSISEGISPGQFEARDDDLPSPNSNVTTPGSQVAQIKEPRWKDLVAARHHASNRVRTQARVVWTPLRAPQPGQADDAPVTSPGRQMIDIENRPPQFDDNTILEWQRDPSHDSSSSGLLLRINAIDQLRGSLVRLFFGWYRILDTNLDAAFLHPSSLPEDDDTKAEILHWKEMVVLVALMFMLGQALAIMVAMEWILRLAWSPRRSRLGRTI